MNKDDAINIMNNSNLNEKRGLLYICIYIYIFVFIIYKKWVKKGYYQRNREAILKRAKKYFENDEESLKEEARNKYRQLFEE